LSRAPLRRREARKSMEANLRIIGRNCRSCSRPGGDHKRPLPACAGHSVGQNEKSLPREEVRQAFEKIERQLGGGVLSFRQAILGGGWSACTSKGCGRRCIASMEIIILISCSVDRHFFAGQLCVMRKAGGSVTQIHWSGVQKQSARSGGSRRWPSLEDVWS